MQAIDNFTRLQSLKSSFGVHVQYTGTASAYIMQSQLRKSLMAAFPNWSAINEFITKHYNLDKTINKVKLVGKVDDFIFKIPDMSDALISKYSDILSEDGIEGMVDCITQNLSKQIKQK